MKKRLPPRIATRHLSALATALSVGLPGAPALAQTAPPPGIGDALKEVQPPRPDAPPRPPAPRVTESGRAPLAVPPGGTLFVRGFRLEGAEFLPEAELLAALAPWTGRELTLAQLEEAAARIGAIYRERGYPVARAWVPRQDASGGTVTLRVIVGRVGKLSIHNSSSASDAAVARTLAGLTEGMVIDDAALERPLLLTDDLAGVALPRLVMSPGRTPGSSDIEAEVDAEPRYTGSISLDNHGSAYTGRNRIGGRLDVNSPLGLGDRLSLAALAAFGGGLANARMAWSAPIGGDGLRAELAASKTAYELGDVYRSLDATGSARSAEARLSYPLIRSRDRNLVVTGAYVDRRMRDDIGSTDSTTPKAAKVASVNVRHEAWGSLLGREGYSSATLGYAQGSLTIDDAEQLALNRAGANTDGRYARLNLALAGSLQLAPAWSGNLSLVSQKALRGRNLDPSEQMSISGPNGVRAWREWISGDNAWLATAELRRALPAPAGMAQSVSLFTDAGRSWLQNAGYATDSDARLADVGLGWTGAWRELRARVQFAHAVGPRETGLPAQGRNRALVQLGAIF